MHVSKVQFWDDSESKQHRQGKQTLKEHWEIASCLNQLINRAVILETTKPSPLWVTVPRSSTRNACFFYRILTKTGHNKSRKSWENNKRKTALANYQTKSPVLTDFGSKVNCKLLRHKIQVIIWRYLSSPKVSWLLQITFHVTSCILKARLSNMAPKAIKKSAAPSPPSKFGVFCAFFMDFYRNPTKW